jgi:hypothetical protein
VSLKIGNPIENPQNPVFLKLKVEQRERDLGKHGEKKALLVNIQGTWVLDSSDQTAKRTE